MSDTKEASTGLESSKPERSGLILTTLILGAVVCNINLAIANVATPSVGRDLGATQVQQNMVASMFTLGLAASVLYFGALGDRYGRKIMLLCGAGLSIPASLLAGFAPNVQVLIAARLLGGLAAGLLYPTTLSLISALWRGPAKTKAIALWSGVSGASMAVGALVGGVLLEDFWWGSVFVLTVPIAAAVLLLGIWAVPSRSGEDRRSVVDHFGGLVSVVAIVALILALQQLPNGLSVQVAVLSVIAVVSIVIFFVREKHAQHPLVDLPAASVPTFWVAWVAGTIAFGAMVGAMFLGQQFTQNILHYSALAAAAASLPVAVFVVITSPMAGQMMIRRGGRLAFVWGLTFINLAFIVMVALWREDTSIWFVLLAYALIGAGAGYAGTAATRSLMTSLTEQRAGMGSAFGDLMRDFGGAIMQVLMGTVLAIVYADRLKSIFSHLPVQQQQDVSSQAAHEIVSSYQGATDVASSYPQVAAKAITDAAASAFSEGKGGAYAFGLVVTLVALLLVVAKYPAKDAEMKVFVQVAEQSKAESEHAAAGAATSA